LHEPNAKKVVAGKSGCQKSSGLTPAGRERLRSAALVNRPWQFSTGPRTPEGKAKAARNGKPQKKNPALQEAEEVMSEVSRLLTNMAALRGRISRNAALH